MAQEENIHLADTTALPSNGKVKQVALSSSGTLFWRVFVPVFSTVMLSGFLLAFLLIPEEELYLPFSATWARLGIAVIWLGWIWMMYRTLWRLHRVDADNIHVYVTNYWRTVRYPWQDVTKYTESRRMGRRIIHLHLRAPGRFGQVISFIPDSHFNQWISENYKNQL
jgi:hypothetical protein